MTETTDLNAALGTSTVTWNLEDLYPADEPELLEKDIARAEEEALAISSE